MKVRGVHLRCLRSPPLSLGASPLSCRPCAVASYSYCGSPVAGSLCCCIIAWGRFFSLRHARRVERSSRTECFIPFFPFILFSYFIMYLMHVTLVCVCVCVCVCVLYMCVAQKDTRDAEIRRALIYMPPNTKLLFRFRFVPYLILSLLGPRY